MAWNGTNLRNLWKTLTLFARQNLHQTPTIVEIHDCNYNKTFFVSYPHYTKQGNKQSCLYTSVDCETFSFLHSSWLYSHQINPGRISFIGAGIFFLFGFNLLIMVRTGWEERMEGTLWSRTNDSVSRVGTRGIRSSRLLSDSVVRQYHFIFTPQRRRRRS